MRELMLTKEIVKDLYYDNSFRFDDYWAFSSNPAKITSVNENADGSVQIKGTVKSFRYNQVQTVSVAINPEKGQILSTSCSCFKLQKNGISKDSVVVCSHVKALLDEFIDGCEEMRWPYKPKQYSSDCLTRTLNAAQRQIENAAVKTEIDTEGSDLNLSFSFGFGDNGISVPGASFYASLQVAGAKTRKFVVKDLRQFIDGLWSHSRITFGKDTEFLLNWDKLNANDRTIIETISSSMVRTNKLSGLEKKPNGKFSMTEAGFVRTVRFFHDNEIPFVFEGLESTISYDYPKLVLLIRKANWDSVLLNFCSGADNEMETCTFGNSVAFFDRPNRVFHLPEVDYATRMIFSMFGEDRIQMASSDFIPFCQNMLPRIQKFATVEGLENLGEVKLPQKPRFKLYLDSGSSSFFLIGRPTAVYDEGEIDIIANKDCSFLRNDMEERRFIKVCAHAMNGYIIDKDKCIHANFGNEDEYYSFLANISDIIAPYGDAMVSSDLSSNMPVRPSFSFASGLSSSGSMLLDVKVDQEVLDQLGEIISAYKLKKRYFKMKNGKPLSLEDESFETLALLSDVLPIESDKLAPGQLEIPSYRALYVDAVLKGAEGLEYRRSDTFKSLVRSIRDWEDNSMVIPQDVEATLRSYQLKGCQWLMSLAENNLGGILADDMGLGKTLEMLTVFASYRQTHGKLSALVVAPASLLLNWVNEMHRFTPSLKGFALLGSSAERKRLLEKGADVIVTSYDLIRRDEALFQGKKFDFIVLDEAQTIKNDHTKISKAVKGIDAAHRFALTGTPIQNRLSDLWSIFDFLMPGFLFSRAEFKKRWETPAGKKNGDEVLEKLKKITAPFVLRRLKSNVLRELPQKTVGVRAVPMESEQSKLYQANYVLARKEFNQIVKKQGLKNSKIQILALLTRLRQICCDPGLLYENYSETSAKLCSVMELVQEAIDGGHSILLFSQFTSMLDILQKKLQSGSIPFYRIDGATSKEKRQEYVDRFQSDDTPVFLISLKAGGLGLNLTKADTIIIYDPWWNVAQEEQAIDRAYRMGQKRNVQVYRLICEQSIEEKIQLIQEKKQHLIEGVLSEGEFQPALDESDWMSLFS